MRTNLISQKVFSTATLALANCEVYIKVLVLISCRMLYSNSLTKNLDGGY